MKIQLQENSAEGLPENLTKGLSENLIQGFPDPNIPYPIQRVGGNIAFLKNIIKRKNVMVGDFTYYHSFQGAQDFEERCLPYHAEGSEDKIVIGKFCQLAADIKFITNDAMHQMTGFSTYPFANFSEVWKKCYLPSFPKKGDIYIGNDVWIGHHATIMPGVTIGDGAIIGAFALVANDVDPYTIVGGNPARLIRPRFDHNTIKNLLKIKWWDWSIQKITDNIAAIIAGDLEALSTASKISSI